MFKNITIFFLIFSLWFWSVFASSQSESQNIDYLNINKTPVVVEWSDWPNWSTDTHIDFNWTSTKQWSSKTSDSPSQSSSPSFKCEWWKDSLCSTSFKIDTNKFSPGWKWLNKTGNSGASKTIDNFLSTTIQKLMVALWSIALLIMIVGAWFMILWAWKDDNVNKWKTIIKSWIIALVVALSSYMLVSFLRFILYANS